jgi:2-polyprenyl-3-methyl-5-hydroxy-6-metoxy-1,4-benzoquinol methylase
MRVTKVGQIQSRDSRRCFARDVADRKGTSHFANQKGQIEFVQSDVFNFKPFNSRFDLVLCLGLIAHTGGLDILLPHLKSMLTLGGESFCKQH